MMLRICIGFWLVWLSGLSAGLRTERSRVQFPVRAHAWVVGQVPSQSMYLLHINIFLPLPLKIRK